jgi:hypothetical protein
MTATGFADTGMILNAAPRFRPRKERTITQ